MRCLVRPLLYSYSKSNTVYIRMRSSPDTCPHTCFLIAATSYSIRKVNGTSIAGRIIADVLFTEAVAALNAWVSHLQPTSSSLHAKQFNYWLYLLSQLLQIRFLMLTHYLVIRVFLLFPHYMSTEVMYGDSGGQKWSILINRFEESKSRCTRHDTVQSAATYCGSRVHVWHSSLCNASTAISRQRTVHIIPGD